MTAAQDRESARQAGLLADPAAIDRDWPHILGFVDLDTCREAVGCLPPVPLIGIGDPAHPLAARLDAVVEPPVSAAALIRSITRAPRAAAALVGLLRAIEGLAPGPALVAESLCYAMLQGSAEHRRWLAERVPPAPLPPGEVRLSRTGDRLDVVLARPAARNAIDTSLRDGLRAAFDLAALDRDIAQVRLSAEGAAFSIGGDLAEFGTTRDPATAHALRLATSPAFAAAAVADRLAVRVGGPCIGSGLEIAAFARRIAASPNAWFQLPELGMGLIPGAGGCVSVGRRIGRQRAALMILSGRRIDARTALRWGLVDEIAGDDGGADQP